MPVSSRISGVVGARAKHAGDRSPEAGRRAIVSQTTIEFTELLGRRVRMGPWEDQKISTYRKILEAFDEGRWDEAAELEAYFVDEASVCFAIYRQWIPDVRGYLL